MRMIIFILCLVNSILVTCNQSDDTTIPAGKSSTSVNDSLIQRIVCFKFKADATAEQIAQHMRGFANLKDSIRYMLTYTAGPTVKADLEQNSEYDVMHYSTYHSEDDIRKYSVHPVHQRFIENNKAIWEKVLVINSKVNR